MIHVLGTLPSFKELLSSKFCSLNITVSPVSSIKMSSFFQKDIYLFIYFIWLHQVQRVASLSQLMAFYLVQHGL